MFIVMVIGLVYFLNENLSLVPIFPFLDFLILFSMKIMFSFGIVLFFLGLIFGVYSFFDKRPAVILDKKGIWIRYYNFIPWEDIIDFDLLVLSIGINVENPIRLSKKSDLRGKMGIFWSKLFNYHHT